MAVTKVLARGWTFQINTGTTAAPTWTPIGGVKSFSVSPSQNDTDTTSFSSNGHQEHLVTSRGMEIKVESFYLVDLDTKTRDAGQEAVETLADGIGEASLGEIKVTSPAGTTWTFTASASVEGPGGGNDDAASWNATFKVSGAITKA